MHFAIVSYIFPPSLNIGGRRWAKFSQQLKQLGHQVTVITSDNSTQKNWYEKEYSGINFIILSKRNPTWLNGYPNSFKEKIFYFIYTRIISRFTSLNLFDSAYAWKKPLLKALSNLHSKQPIDVMVTTGGPFSLLYYGALFKKQHQEIQFVADLRDPWTWGSLYGMANLTPKKKKYQNIAESKTIEFCDMMSYPTQSMGDYLKQKYPSFSHKLYLLPHAYDPNKFPQNQGVENKHGFIYGGTLYNGLEQLFERLERIINNNLDSDFKWDIYTGKPYAIFNPNFANGRIKKFPFVPEEELFQKIKNASAYLVFFPESEKDIISTKFFEIIYAETPILYIGEEGEVAKFIRENRVGVHILPDQLEQELPKYLNGKVPFEKGYFDVSQYSFSNVTKNFLGSLDQYKN